MAIAAQSSSSSSSTDAVQPLDLRPWVHWRTHCDRLTLAWRDIRDDKLTCNFWGYGDFHPTTYARLETMPLHHDLDGRIVDLVMQCLNTLDHALHMDGWGVKREEVFKEWVRRRNRAFVMVSDDELSDWSLKYAMIVPSFGRTDCSTNVRKQFRKHANRMFWMVYGYSLKQ